MTPSALLDRLGLRYPIIQAPMAGIATPELAAAVSNAGGLGSLGLGASTPAQARQMITATRALTPLAFNVNVFCHRPAQRDDARESAWLAHLAPFFAEMGAPVPNTLTETYRSFCVDDAMLAVLLELRPAVVSCHFGLPSATQIEALHAAGIVLMATATQIDEARRLENAGIDVLIAQGIEAGGHRGVFAVDAADERLSTSVLTRLLVRQTCLPVVATGGIMDGAGLGAVLALGAVAAQLGTAFILCPESAADAGYRAALLSPRAATTRLTDVISGRPARAIVQRFIEAAAGGPRPADYPLAYDVAKQLHRLASRRGSQDFAAHWAGQGAPLARAMSAAELVASLVAEWQAGPHRAVREVAVMSDGEGQVCRGGRPSC